MRGTHVNGVVVLAELQSQLSLEPVWAYISPWYVLSDLVVVVVAVHSVVRSWRLTLRPEQGG